MIGPLAGKNEQFAEAAGRYAEALAVSHYCRGRYWYNVVVIYQLSVVMHADSCSSEADGETEGQGDRSHSLLYRRTLNATIYFAASVYYFLTITFFTSNDNYRFFVHCCLLTSFAVTGWHCFLNSLAG